MQSLRNLETTELSVLSKQFCRLMIQKTKNRPIGIAVPMSQKQRTIKVHHIQVHCSTEKERLQSENFIEEVTYGELQENEGSDD